MVDFCKCPTQRCRLRRESSAYPDLGRLVLGPQEIEGHLPAVDCACKLLNHHREIGVQLPPARHPAALDPAVQTCYVGNAGRVESSVGFDIEIVTEFQSAEELQNGGIAEQD
jgi:hypothetical protein